MLLLEQGAKGRSDWGKGRRKPVMFVYFIINNSGISSPSPGPEPAESLFQPLGPVISGCVYGIQQNPQETGTNKWQSILRDFCLRSCACSAGKIGNR